MIRNIAFRLVRYRVKFYLPTLNSKLYNKIFTYTYKFFVLLKPSQMLIIILALLNKTELKTLIQIPSILLLFNTFFSDNNSPKLNINKLTAKLEANKLIDKDNNWEVFFWIVIVLAIIKRFITSLFKFIRVPFKVALCYYTLKYFGFYFNYAFNVLNTLSIRYNWLIP